MLSTDRNFNTTFFDPFAILTPTSNTGLRDRLDAEDARSTANKRGFVVVSTYELHESLPDLSLAMDYPIPQHRLAELLLRGGARPFSLPKCMKAPLEPEAWLRADRMVEVAHEEYFEPYVMASRRGLPSFDERFRGYRCVQVLGCFCRC
jgi:hypothetical protein